MSQLLVRELMTKTPHTIGVRLTLADAAKVMKKYKIRHLPVLESGALVGVLSERDVQMISALSDLDPTCILVEEAMSQAPWTVSPDTSVLEVATTMAEKKLGSAVVMENDRVIGVFTTTDGMRCLAQLLGKKAKA
jgi:acetoin utilization protein AcuB